MATIFTRIIRGEIPSHKVAESERFYAFLDINPVADGHTLVVPKFEVDYFFDLPDDWLSEIMIFSRAVATALRQVVACERIGLSVIGLEVPHAHVHLIPINSMRDMDFGRTRRAFSTEEFAALAGKIAARVTYPNVH